MYHSQAIRGGLCSILPNKRLVGQVGPSSNSYNHNEPWLQSTSSEDISCNIWRTTVHFLRPHPQDGYHGRTPPYHLERNNSCTNGLSPHDSSTLTKAFDFDQSKPTRLKSSQDTLGQDCTWHLSHLLALLDEGIGQQIAHPFWCPHLRERCLLCLVEWHDMLHHITPYRNLRPHLWCNFPSPHLTTWPFNCQVTIQQHDTQGVSSCAVPIQGCAPKALGCLRKVLWPPQA